MSGNLQEMIVHGCSWLFMGTAIFGNFCLTHYAFDPEMNFNLKMEIMLSLPQTD